MIPQPELPDVCSKRRWLLDQRQQAQGRLGRWRLLDGLWAWMRLVVFAAGATVIALVWGQGWLWAGLSAVFLALFAASINRQRRCQAQREHLGRVILILDEALKRIGGRVALVRSFERPAPGDDCVASLPGVLDDGPVWPLSEQELDDFDIFCPPVGMFGLLNRCSTKIGELRLQRRLERISIRESNILARQEAVGSLADDAAGRVAMMAGAAALRGHDKYLDGLLSAVCNAQPIGLGRLGTVLRVWSWLSGAFMVFALGQMLAGKDGYVTLALLVLVFNAAVYAPMWRKMRKLIEPWKSLGAVSRQLEIACRAAGDELAGCRERCGEKCRGRLARASCGHPARTGRQTCDIAGEPAGAAPPSEGQQRLGVAQSGAPRCDTPQSGPPQGAAQADSSTAMGELARLGAAFAAVCRRDVLPTLQRRLGWADAGGPIHELLNFTIFYDLHVIGAIHACAIPNRDALLRGVAALADLEMLASMACFACEQPVACLPAPAQGGQMEIVGGLHPLIDPAGAVANTVAPGHDKRIWVITGPNAAGKSTLLRMIGLNAILAQAGGFVTAGSMSWTPGRLMSDLQVRDDLSREESYFLAEVRHLKRIVTAGQDGPPMMGLIDEPFRGTNAKEKRAASMALVEHLAGREGLMFVATHDGAVADLAATFPQAENYHFEADDGQGRVVFDYRLHAGPASTTTAIRIMEQEGFPPELVKRAKEHQ